MTAANGWQSDQPARAPRATVEGFGHQPEKELHHFIVALPRSQGGIVQVYEVFEADMAGPALESRNLRVTLDVNRWLKIADALEDEFNTRLRAAGLRAGKWKAGHVPVARLFGKELVLLAWAIEDAEPTLAYTAIQNWRGLAPEERWWLYTMTAAQTGHHAQRGRGWRKAVRAALTENPVHTGPAAPTSAERRREARLLARARPAPGQPSLLDPGEPGGEGA
jgi:hypothetical protein